MFVQFCGGPLVLSVGIIGIIEDTIGIVGYHNHFVCYLQSIEYPLQYWISPEDWISSTVLLLSLHSSDCIPPQYCPDFSQGDQGSRL